MKKTLFLSILLSLFLNLSSCSSVALSDAGSNVVIAEVVSEDCKSLGLVIGEGGSAWKGGAYYKNSTLLEYAQNDLRNKAAEKGATHIVIKSSNLGTSGSQYGSTVTGANLTGTAYRCGLDRSLEVDRKS